MVVRGDFVLFFSQESFNEMIFEVELWECLDGLVDVVKNLKAVIVQVRYNLSIFRIDSESATVHLSHCHSNSC